MHIACFSFGIGAILVNLGSKKLFEDRAKFYHYFDFKFNENNDENDPTAKYFQMADEFTARVKRSETVRLLERKNSD